MYVISGAYEPPKAAKEHETYTVRRVPSQSKYPINRQLVSI